ncbi:MAG: undecaprenyl-phosphate glucose phosphotransferase, partial [Alphaproteobacteria bacterium]
MAYQEDESRKASATTATATTASPARRVAGAHRTLNAAARAVAQSLSRQSISPVLLAGLARAVEYATTMLLGMIIYFIYVQQTPGIDWLYTVPIVGGPFVAILFIQLADGYSVPALRAVNLHLGRIFAAWTLLFAIFTIVAFLAKIGDNYSRIWIGTWYLAGLAAFTFIRIVLSRLVGAWTQSGRLERRAVIVGGGDLAVKLIGALEAQTDNDIRICGVFDDRSDERSPQVVAGYPKLGTFDELVDFGRIARIDMLIVSLPITAESRLLTLLKRLWVLPVDIRLSAHAAKIRFRPRSYSFVGTVPL